MTASNSLNTAISIGTFGTVNSSTNLFPSYYSGQQTLNGGPVYYQFTVSSGQSENDLQFFLPDGGDAGYDLLNSSLQEVTPGSFSNYFFNLSPGTYYLEVGTAASSGSYAFGVTAFPDILNYTGSFSHETAATALNLGALSSGGSVSESDSFYTLFNRISPTSSTPAGSLTPDYSNPYENDQTAFYSFTLNSAGSVTITEGGTHGNFILYAPAQGNIGSPFTEVVQSGQPIQLIAGTYQLEVVDSDTNATASGNGVTAFRNAQDEDYENFNFAISLGAGSSISASVNSLSSTSLSAGSTFTVNESISNSGPAVSSADYAVYLSTTPTITTSDQLLDVGYLLTGIGANSTVNLTTPALTIPANLAPGTYYVGVIPDYDYASPGVASSGTAITVTGGTTSEGVPALWRNTSGEVDTWLLNNGQMSGGAALGSVSGAWRFAGDGDITGNGTSDVLWQNTSTGEVDTWLLNAGHLSGGAAIGHAASVWQPLGTGDFTDNGIQDLLWRNTSTGEVDTWLMTNGQVSGGTAVSSLSGAWQFAGIGDFTGSGTSDILWHNTTTGEVDTWLITNGHLTGGAAIGHASSAWQSLGTGDFNGNGTSDILWRNTTTGEVDTWLMTNGQVTGGATLGSVSSAWQFAGIGNYAGSGTSDILWRNTNTGEVDTWLITNDRLTGGTAISSAAAAWQPQVIHTS